MMWTICFGVAVAAMAVFGGLALAAGRYSLRISKALRPIHMLFAGCIVMCVSLCLPAYYAAYAGTALQGIKAVVLSVQRAIRVFGADGMYSAVFEQVHHAPQGLQTAYLSLTLGVQFFAPLLSFGFIMSFFKNVSASLRYWMSWFRDVYIFSGLNRRALLLARDIMQNHPRARIVFADAYDGSEDRDAELMEKARALRAICFRKGIHAVDWGMHSSKKQMYFFAIGRDEVQNADHALRLVERYNERENTHLYIFSTGVEGELLLAARERGRMKVRRINPVRSLVLRVLQEEGSAIFSHALPIEGEHEKQISAVIVGMGGHGTEMLKALCWYCQMDGYRLKINAFDRDGLAEERFAARCPELMDEKYNGVFVDGEAAYQINVHDGCDVETKGFADQLSKITDATYVFISLGSDEQNIRTAVDIRMRFERMGLHPEICCVLSSEKVKKSLGGVQNHAGQPYDITFVGDAKEAYSEKVILGSEVEEEAYRRHCAYCNGNEEKMEAFWRYEYNYHSSMALAIHAAARRVQGIPGADKADSELTPEERDGLEILEHRRWNAYMRSEGYVYSGSREKSSRNDLARMHHNLVDFDDLTTEVKRIDSRVGAGV